MIKRVKQGDFHGFEGLESKGFSTSQFGFVVEALDHGGRDGSSGAEPIENKLTMLSHRASDSFHRPDPRAQDASALSVEKATGKSSFKRELRTERGSYWRSCLSSMSCDSVALLNIDMMWKRSKICTVWVAFFVMTFR
jgi:hypothetical protein